jgi:hypothetical protein
LAQRRSFTQREKKRKSLFLFSSTGCGTPAYFSSSSFPLAVSAFLEPFLVDLGLSALVSFAATLASFLSSAFLAFSSFLTFSLAFFSSRFSFLDFWFSPSALFSFFSFFGFVAGSSLEENE